MGKRYSYQFNYPKSQDLLERLRNKGLIDEIGSNSIFNDISNRSINVRKHFAIAERAKKYLEALARKGLGKELENLAKKSGYKS